MDPDTGHLISDEHLDFGELVASGSYVPIPVGLELAAKKKLAGRKEAQVSLTSGGKLSRFAVSERKKRRRWKKYRRFSR